MNSVLKTFKSIYSNLVKKADDVDSTLFNEQLDLLVDVVKNGMSTEELKTILKEKIERDRRNTDLYLSHKDRSAVNRVIYEEHIRLRSLVIICTVILFSSIGGFIGLLFCIDLYISYTRDHDTIVKYIDFLNMIIGE